MKLKYFILSIIFMMMTACASLQGNGESLQLPVTYGTMKIIERDNGIGSEDVQDVVDRLQGVLDNRDTITSTLIRDYIYSHYSLDGLPPSDVLLIDTLFSSVEESVKEAVANKQILPEDIRERIGVVLGWVEDAAVLSSGGGV